ncbi:MAG: hypothetical protein WC955_05900 [Elusimicrobiota bacterium]
MFKRTTVVKLSCILSLILMLIPAQVYAEKVSIAILDLKAQPGVSAEDAAVTSDFFRGHFLDSGEFRMLERTEMAKMLGNQQFEDSICNDESCAAKAGSLLKVEKMGFGSIGKFEGQYQIILKIVDVGTGEILSMRRGSCPDLTSVFDKSREMTKDVISDVIGKQVDLKAVQKPVTASEKKITDTTETPVVSRRSSSSASPRISAPRVRMPSGSLGYDDNDDVGGFGVSYRTMIIDPNFKVLLDPVSKINAWSTPVFGYYMGSNTQTNLPMTLQGLTTSFMLSGPYFSMVSLNAFEVEGLIMRGGFGFGSTHLRNYPKATITDSTVSYNYATYSYNYPVYTLKELGYWEMDWDVSFSFPKPLYWGIAYTWGALTFPGTTPTVNGTRDMFEWQWYSSLAVQGGLMLRMSEAFSLDLSARYPVFGTQPGYELTSSLNLTFVRRDEGIMGTIPWFFIWLPLMGLMFTALDSY